MKAGPVRGTITGSGEAIWSVDRGRLLSLTAHAEVTLQVEITVGSESVRMNMGVDASEHRELDPLASGASRPLVGSQGSGQPAPADATGDPASPPASPSREGRE